MMRDATEQVRRAVPPAACLRRDARDSSPGYTARRMTAGRLDDKQAFAHAKPRQPQNNVITLPRREAGPSARKHCLRRPGQTRNDSITPPRCRAFRESPAREHCLQRPSLRWRSAFPPAARHNHSRAPALPARESAAGNCPASGGRPRRPRPSRRAPGG